MKVKMLRGSVGNGFSFAEGDIVERSSANAERIDSLLRHGGAEVVGQEKKKVEEGGGKGENPDVLHDAPAQPRGRKRSDKTKGS